MLFASFSDPIAGIGTKTSENQFLSQQQVVGQLQLSSKTKNFSRSLSLSLSLSPSLTSLPRHIINFLLYPSFCLFVTNLSVHSFSLFLLLTPSIIFFSLSLCLKLNPTHAHTHRHAPTLSPSLSLSCDHVLPFLPLSLTQSAHFLWRPAN